MKSNNQPAFNQIIASLNARQLSAVKTIDGPVLVLAGPGTGKTQLLAARICNILQDAGAQARPQDILCLTYTDAGTVAMRKRLISFIGAEAYKVNIHTFHSFCNAVIQQNRDCFDNQEVQAISEIEKIELLHQLIDNFQPDNVLKKYTGEIYSDAYRLSNLFDTMKKERFTVQYLLDKIADHLENYSNREDVTHTPTGKLRKQDIVDKKITEEQIKYQRAVAAIAQFDKYQALMKEAKRYDFADMISWVIDAFETNPNLLADYQERYLYVLVDEFQDTNGSQNQLLQLLTSYWDSPNLFVVGDDDQAVYGFQGADIGRINEFVNQFKDSLFPVVLEQNYRSSQLVLDTAAKVIANNTERLIYDQNLIKIIGAVEKNLIAANDFVAKKTTEVHIIEYLNALHEAAGIVKHINAKKEAGEPINDIAIIYHNHKDIEKIIAVFNHLHIPYNARRKVNILNEPLVTRILNILRFLKLEAQNMTSGDFLLFEMMHYQFFCIDVNDIAKIAKAIALIDNKEVRNWKSFISSSANLEALRLVDIEAIKSFNTLINNWQKALYNETLQVLVEQIINQNNLLPMLLTKPSKVWNTEIINSFFNLIKSESDKNEHITLFQFLDTIDKMQNHNISYEVEKITSNKDGVNLVTAHSSKGLEYDSVFIINTTKDAWNGKSNSNSFPLPDNVEKSNTAIKEEEERRLFYVAMTRAKRNLYISYPAMKLKDTSTDNGTAVPSVFISEIDITPIPTQLPDEEIADFVLKALETPAFDHSIIDHSLVDKFLETYEMSASALNKYLRCPVAFYYENILKIPEARSAHAGFGSAVHYALEKYVGEIKSNTDENLPPISKLAFYFEIGMKRNSSSFTLKDYELKLAYGKIMLAEYHAEHALTWTPNALLEYRIHSATSTNVPISGSIDRLDIDGNNCHLIDYKTGNPDNAGPKLYKPNDKHLHGGEYWRQMVFYKILLEADKTHHWSMNSGSFNFVLKSKKSDEYVNSKIVVSSEDVNFVSQLISETYLKMQNYEFEEGCQDSQCRWCNFPKEVLN